MPDKAKQPSPQHRQVRWGAIESQREARIKVIMQIERE